MRNRLGILLSSALALPLLVFASPASATIIIFELDDAFDPLGGSPQGDTPWLTAVLDDGGGSGSVMLTMGATNNLVETEHVDSWLFNVDPAMDASTLVFTPDSGAPATVSTGSDSFVADGDGSFDVMFDFPAFTFGSEQNSVWTITGEGLTAESFNFFSSEAGTQGTFTSAANIEGIQAGGQGSVWIGSKEAVAPPPGGGGEIPVIPEPSTLAILGLGLCALGRRSRK